MQRHSGWVVALNSYTDSHIDCLRAPTTSLRENGYLLFGYGSALSTGTEHLQGYVRSNTPRHFNDMTNPELLVKWPKPQIYTIKTAHHSGTAITRRRQLSLTTFMDGYHGTNRLRFVINIPKKLKRKEASKNLRLNK